MSTLVALGCVASAPLARSNRPRRAPRARVITRATSPDDDASAEGETEAYGRNPLTGEPLEARGQMTAIVTGVVSVAIAVGYLALVQVFDSREMLPPPPEALGDGSEATAR